MQHGSVVASAADTQALHEWLGFKSSTIIEIVVQIFLDGIEKFKEYN